MNANHENHDGSDELLRLLGWALGRGPLAGPAEAQAAFDAAAGERLSADELAWLSRLTRGNMLSNDDTCSTKETGHISTKETGHISTKETGHISTKETGHLPSAASVRLAKMHGQRLRAESLERRDATAPFWPVPDSSMAAWDGGCELATSGFESSDWGPGGAAVSAALVGGVLAVWFSSGQRRQMSARTTYDEAKLYDRALVELADGCLVA